MGGVRVAALTAAGASGLATLTAATLPRTHLTSRQPPQHTPLETVASIIAHLAGSQIFGRLLWQGRFNEPILASASAVFILITISHLTMPALAEQFTNDLTMWTFRAGWFLGAAQLAHAAFALCRPLQMTLDLVPCVRMET